MTAAQAAFEKKFDELRAELGVRIDFPPEVLAAAREAAGRVAEVTAERVDRRAVPFLTVDPPGSRDLDQALHIERAGKGFRVRYAIADVGFWVDRGGAIEAEAWRRRVTYYAPDRRAPLYPPVLSEGAASLLPGQDRPAVLFTLELDSRGALVRDSVERALVRSRRQMSYQEVLAEVESGEAEEVLLLLREVGELRAEREKERGGTSLPARDQHVQRWAASRLGYRVEFERPTPAEDWNAQISLLTGHAAALRMMRAGVGLLRTLAPPRPEDVRRFRVVARTLGFEWPKQQTYADFINSLPLDHVHLEPLLWQARHVMRGAGYLAFQGGAPAPEVAIHAALAFDYSHCTAPLRRLADRYVLDLLVELARGEHPSPDEIATLAELKPVMEEADRRAHALERRAVDLAEAWVLRGREGDRFLATVLAAQPGWIDAQIEDPPVRARVHTSNGADLSPGSEVQVRLERVDAAAGAAEFELE